MTAPDVFDLAAGRMTAWHRLAVAVRCLDARTGAPVPGPLLIRREVFGPRPALRELIVVGSAATLTYAASVGSRVVLRIEDPRRWWLPRRLALRPPARARALAAEADPPGTYLPAAGRALDVRLFPGPAHPLPSRAPRARASPSRGRGWRCSGRAAYGRGGPRATGTGTP
jgi:hypothetical protein